MARETATEKTTQESAERSATSRTAAGTNQPPATGKAEVHKTAKMREEERLVAEREANLKRQGEKIAPNRWGVILRETGEIIDIKIMEGGVEPEVDEKDAELYDTEQLPSAAMIGMKRGGTKDAVGGFGFEEGSEGAANRSVVGATRVRDTAA